MFKIKLEGTFSREQVSEILDALHTIGQPEDILAMLSDDENVQPIPLIGHDENGDCNWKAALEEVGN